MKILTLTSYFEPGFKGGGPIKTISNLIKNTCSENRYKVLTKDRDLGEKRPYKDVVSGRWLNKNDYDVFYSRSGLAGFFERLKVIFTADYDLIYFNSLFSLQYSFIPLIFARLLGKTIILGPRGELSEGALSIRPMRKRVFIKVFRILKLHKHLLFQASSPHEKEDIREKLGSGVAIYVAEDIAAPVLSGLNFPKKCNKIKLIFVSRVSPKKNLVKALDILKGLNFSVQFDIYGPIEDRVYWSLCERMIDSMPSNIDVNYKGELRPDNVVSTMVGYDAFFLPTQGENYGHVIAEALSAGLPLIISDQTPWRNLFDEGLGWDLALDDVDEYRSSIKYLHSLSEESHSQFRKRVFDWAVANFEFSTSVKDNLAMFKFALLKNKDK
jgi:glycosyltransferase involved in cell wall biosynthesis